jgi:LysM repeat protein
MARHLQLSVRLSLFLVAVFVVFLLIGGAAQAVPTPEPTVEYVVESGDTLWGIANELAGPEEDVRVIVTTIKRLSGVESSTLQPGQRLRLPEG